MCLVPALVLLFGSVEAFATNFAVGTCKPSLPSFTTISAAVAAVPPLSTVFVCPGTYPEQVTINQPLTLKGVTEKNSAQVVVAAPSGGLSANVNSIFVGLLDAQVAVTAGPVNITNITVDGANNSVNGSPWLAGIFYQGGSSGVISHVTTRNQINSGKGVGIWLENGTANAESITLQNSSVHDVDYSGIIAGDATLNVTITGNSVSSAYIGIALGATGSAASNRVSAGAYGIYQNVGTASANTVMNSPIGIYTYGSGTSDTSNKIFNSSSYGIYLTANGQTVKFNTITESNIAIEFACTTGDIVSGNTINDAVIGLNDVPSGFSGANSFFSVATVSNDGCTSSQTVPKLKVPIPNMSH